MDSPKYNRTFHVPWSPGGTNDDKVASSTKYLLNVEIIITEKVDGSNVCMERNNCYARTHAGPPSHPSFDAFKALHAGMKYQLEFNAIELLGRQVFGEWCYALHSIPYDKLPGYFLMFGVRVLASEYWLSWDDTVELAGKMGVPTVPVLFRGVVKTEAELRELTEKLAKEPSELGTIREGVVIRLAGAFEDEVFDQYVMKYVRANHVQTDDHWKDQEIIKNKLKA